VTDINGCTASALYTVDSALDCGAVITSAIPSNLCQGQSFAVSFTTSYTPLNGNVFTVQLSNSSGSFSAPTPLGSLTSTAMSGTINATVPLYQTPDSSYRVRVQASNPVYRGVNNGYNITINARPTATITANGSTTICSGSNVELRANTGSGLTYQWRRGSSFLSGQTNFNYFANTSGSYSVQVINAAGCSRFSNSIKVSLVTCRPQARFDELYSEGLSMDIYPNPADQVTNLNLKGLKDEGELISLQIYDLAGKLVMETRQLMKAGEDLEISTQELASGSYLVRVSNSISILQGRLSVSH
jgi:hypothetical protein